MNIYVRKNNKKNWTTFQELRNARWILKGRSRARYFRGGPRLRRQDTDTSRQSSRERGPACGKIAKKQRGERESEKERKRERKVRLDGGSRIFSEWHQITLIRGQRFYVTPIEHRLYTYIRFPLEFRESRRSFCCWNKWIRQQPSTLWPFLWESDKRVDAWFEF